jgi:hypothetical protein
MGPAVPRRFLLHAHCNRPANGTGSRVSDRLVPTGAGRVGARHLDLASAGRRRALPEPSRGVHCRAFRRGTGGKLAAGTGRSDDDRLRRGRRRWDRLRDRRLRHGGRHGRRGCGRRHGCRRRGGGISRRKQGQRVDVGLAVTDPEVHVRDLVLGRAGGSRLGDRLPLDDERATLHEQRADVRERHLVPGRREDRERQPVGRNLARKRDLALGRRPDDPRVAEAHVDAAMLPAGVRVVPELEAAQHLALRGPRPCSGRRRRRERPTQR